MWQLSSLTKICRGLECKHAAAASQQAGPVNICAPAWRWRLSSLANHKQTTVPGRKADTALPTAGKVVKLRAHALRWQLHSLAVKGVGSAGTLLPQSAGKRETGMPAESYKASTGIALLLQRKRAAIPAFV